MSDVTEDVEVSQYTWGDTETASCSVDGKVLTLDTCALDVYGVRWTLCKGNCFSVTFGDSNQEQ